MMVKYFLLLSGFIGYLFVSIKSQAALLKSIYFSNQQKFFHSLLIWLLPFLWYIMADDFLKPDDRVMTKPLRDELQERQAEDGSFYESGIGIFGV